MHPFYWLSLTSRRLLATSSRSRRLNQYNATDRQLLRVVDLPQHVNDVYHAVQATHDTFVFGHCGMLQDKRQYAVSELFSCCRR